MQARPGTFLTGLRLMLNMRQAMFASILVFRAAGSHAADAVSLPTAGSLTKKPVSGTAARSTINASAASTKVRIRGGRMQTRIENGKLLLTGFQGKFGGGHVDLTGRISTEGGTGNSAIVQVTEVSLNKAMEVLGQTQLMKGVGNVSLTGKVDLKWQGSSLEEMLSSASGSIVLSTGSGSISNGKFLETVMQAGGIANLSDLRFSAVQLEAHLHKGEVRLEACKVHGPDFILTAKGNFSTDTEMVHASVDVAVSPTLAEQSSYFKLKSVAGFFSGFGKTSALNAEAKVSDEWVKMPRLYVSGQLQNPSVRLGSVETPNMAGQQTASVETGKENGTEKAVRMIAAY